MADSARRHLGTDFGDRFADEFPEIEPEVRADLDNLRAALDVEAPVEDLDTAPLAMWTAYLLFGLDFGEALRRTDAALATVADETWRRRLRITRIRANWALGRWGDVETDAVDLLARPGADPSRELLLWNFVGIAQWRMGRLDDADASLDRAAACASDDDARLLALHNRGLVAFSRGDLPAAARWFSAARPAPLGDGPLSGIVGMRLADIALERGRVDEAIELARQVIDSLRRAVDHAGDDDGTAGPCPDRARRRRSRRARRRALGRGRGRVGTGRADRRAAPRWPTLDSPPATPRAPRQQRRQPTGWRCGCRRSTTDGSRSTPWGWPGRRAATLPGARLALLQALEVGASGLRADMDCNLAVVERAGGEAEPSWRRLRGVLERTAAVGNAPLVANTCCYLADAAAAAGDIDLAATLLGAAEGLRSTAGIERGRVRARGEEAETALAALDDAAAMAMAARRAAGRSLDFDAILTLVPEAHEFAG